MIKKTALFPLLPASLYTKKTLRVLNEQQDQVLNGKEAY